MKRDWIQVAEVVCVNDQWGLKNGHEFAVPATISSSLGNTTHLAGNETPADLLEVALNAPPDGLGPWALMPTTVCGRTLLMRTVVVEELEIHRSDAEGWFVKGLTARAENPLAGVDANTSETDVLELLLGAGWSGALNQCAPENAPTWRATLRKLSPRLV